MRGKPRVGWRLLREILQKAPMLPPKKTAQEQAAKLRILLVFIYLPCLCWAYQSVLHQEE